MNRAKEIGVKEEDLRVYIQEAIALYKLEEEKRRAEQEKINAPLRAERRKKFEAKVAKLGKIAAIAGAAVGVAAVFLKAQENSVNKIAAAKGNYKISNTQHHTSTNIHHHRSQTNHVQHSYSDDSDDLL